jgi:predicted transcriptional regulator
MAMTNDQIPMTSEMPAALVIGAWSLDIQIVCGNPKIKTRQRTKRRCVMTLPISAELQRRLEERARDRQISVESLVGEALEWYLQLEPSLVEEFDAWQDVRDEALAVVEGDRL